MTSAGEPNKSIVPLMEHYVPESLHVERQCAQTAYSVLRYFGQQWYVCEGDTVTIEVVSGRVDSLHEDNEEQQNSIRLRAVHGPSLDVPGCIFLSCTDIECEHYKGERVCVAAVLEVGVSHDDKHIYDQDFEWYANIAIITSMSKDDGLEDVYICDAQTGRQLTSAEATELMFLLSHMQQNLTMSNEEELALAALALSRASTYDTESYGSDDIDSSSDDDELDVASIVPVYFEESNHI